MHAVHFILPKRNQRAVRKAEQAEKKNRAELGGQQRGPLDRGKTDHPRNKQEGHADFLGCASGVVAMEDLTLKDVETRVLNWLVKQERRIAGGVILLQGTKRALAGELGTTMPT